MNRRRWMTLVLLLIGLAGCSKPPDEAAGKGEAAQESGVKVRAQQAQRRAVSEAVDGLGKCEALLDKLITLTPAVEGHVEKILAMPGDTVKADQAIVELDPTIARADLAEKTAARDTLVAALRVLQSLPRLEERKPQELAVQQAQVAVERARAVVDRLRPLRQRNEIPELQLYDAEQALAQATLQQQAAEAQLKAMLLGPRPEAVAEAQARIAAAEAAVASTQARLDLHTIRSPIEGVLDHLTCHPGQAMAVGTPIGEVVDLRHVYAMVWLPSKTARSVRVGQSARIMPADSPSSPRDGSPADDEALTGKVEFIDRLIDPQTGNLAIRILVDNSAGRLVAGQTVEVSITVRQRADVLVVPAAAVFDLGKGLLLNVVRDGKSVTLHPPATAVYKDWIEITGTDLKQEEPVITEGGFNLPEGTAVTIDTTESTPEKGAPQ